MSHTYTKSKLFLKDKGISGEMVSSETIFSVIEDQYWEANKEIKTSKRPNKERGMSDIY